MNDLLEYYLVGGRMEIGKKELMLELLRKDSILRVLLGYDAGNPESLISRTDVSSGKETVVVNFNGRGKLKLEGDPTPMLNELKARYGGNLGGSLSFHCIYTTFEWVYYYSADLEADNIVLA